ncbi:MAG: type II toxin-antitoxin system HicA family toxin [Muribaculaceae bacterium]|nr:type II toxin-antitoxin system HicA family toxin [Muribaculaceae bacterium]
MKWNEMKRLAVANGFRFVASRGKHDEYFNEESGITILLERHGSQEVRTGLMNRLLKQIKR